MGYAAILIFSKELDTCVHSLLEERCAACNQKAADDHKQIYCCTEEFVCQ